MTFDRRTMGTLLGVAALLAGPRGLAAQGGSGGSGWVAWDESSRTATLQLVAGPFIFNDAAGGAAGFVVPAKANVVIDFVNKDGTPHSAELISGEGPLPNSAVDPAIPRAYTNKVQEGLPQEAGDVMRFTAPDSGVFRIFCGVPGHGVSGMWLWFKVDPAAARPSFGPVKQATPAPS